MDEIQVTLMSCARVPTRQGEFQVCLYNNNRDHKEHLVLIHGDIHDQKDVMTRIHSECFTGDVLGSERCDCGEQLKYAMKAITAEGKGIVLYLRQEGRGIGLLDKLRAYNLQDEGYDTVEANLLLGHQPDEREYGIAASLLEDLNVRSIQLLTNNPQKIESLQKSGISVTRRVPLPMNVTEENADYLETKRQRMNHLFLPVRGRTKSRPKAYFEKSNERTS